MTLECISKAKKRWISCGLICLILSVAAQGMALSILILPMLQQYDAVEYVSLIAVLGAIGLTVMTPLGGKLGDLFGRKRVIVIFGIIGVIFNMALAFSPNVVLLMVFRLGIGLAQGAYIATPYIIAGKINDKEDVPKAMGVLAGALCSGGFLGSFLAGILNDKGYLRLAMMIPVLPLLAGVLLIGICYPKEERNISRKIDGTGMLFLTIAVSGILVSLNFGTHFGWFHPLILCGFILGIPAGLLFLHREKNCAEPVVPIKIFSNKKYRAFVFVSFICYFYRGAMDVYAPLGVMKVMGRSTVMAGMLQFVRMLVMIFLPVFAGAWVSKKAGRMWMALLITTGFIAFPMFSMGFLTKNSSIWYYMIPLTLTAVSDSFRGASITPGAQESLDAKQLGAGTSMINFVNALSGSVAAALFGIVYDSFVINTAQNMESVIRGVNAVFLFAAGVSLVGFLYVLFFMKAVLKPQRSGCHKEKNNL